MSTFLAILPTLILLSYIYKKDRLEKEPRILILKVFLLGIISAVPIMIFEDLFSYFVLSELKKDTYFYIIIDNLFGIALFEEYFKRWAVKRGVWKNKEFNCQFDGIVYGVAAALGFATIENILYVLDAGIGLSVMRAFTAVPGHAVDGVIMGFFLSNAKKYEVMGNRGLKRRNMRYSLLIPMILHGIYDFLLEIPYENSIWIFLSYILVLDLFCIRLIKKSSRNDSFF